MINDDDDSCANSACTSVFVGVCVTYCTNPGAQQPAGVLILTHDSSVAVGVVEQLRIATHCGRLGLHYGVEFNVKQS